MSAAELVREECSGDSGVLVGKTQEGSTLPTWGSYPHGSGNLHVDPVESGFKWFPAVPHRERGRVRQEGRGPTRVTDGSGRSWRTVGRRGSVREGVGGSWRLLVPDGHRATVSGRRSTAGQLTVR